MELKEKTNIYQEKEKRSNENFKGMKKYLFIVMIFVIILSGFVLVNNISSIKEDSFLDKESKGNLI